MRKIASQKKFQFKILFLIYQIQVRTYRVVRLNIDNNNWYKVLDSKLSQKKIAEDNL